MEFRNITWWNDEVYSLMKGSNIAFCIYELAGLITPDIITADFVYVRLHGPGNKYQGRYSIDALRSWGGKFSKWSNEGRIVYCYFDNDDSGYAAYNAIELNEILNRQ